jgi:putative nucleotidyltransferase with HDIG domain
MSALTLPQNPIEFNGLDYVPPALPSVAVQLHHLTQEYSIDLAKVQILLESDPFLAGQFIRVAQNPLFSKGNASLDLARSLSRLGANTVKEVLWQISMHLRVFRNKILEPVLAQGVRHSVVTAKISRLIAKYTPQMDTGTLYVCGLLHDIGLLAMLAEYAEQSPELELGDIRSFLEDEHAQASATIAHSWHLPKNMINVFSEHHAHKAFPPEPSIDAILYISHAISEKQKSGCPMEKIFSMQVTQARLEQAWLSLDLSAVNHMEISRGLRDIFL